MLRPIDVIFKHPVKKFTVLYQNGKLWQLPRLDFDGNSLRHKRPYTGSREQIFVAQDQRLPADDLLLRSQLATLELPATVAGKNVDEFERWWQQNSYECRDLSDAARQQQAHAKALLANPNDSISATLDVSPSITTPATSPASTPLDSVLSNPNTFNPLQATTATNQSQSVSLTPATSSPDLTDFDDIFGDMMTDLTKDLR